MKPLKVRILPSKILSFDILRVTLRNYAVEIRFTHPRKDYTSQQSEVPI